MQTTYKILYCYHYDENYLGVNNMLEAALRKRPEVTVYRLGQIEPKNADLVLNAHPGKQWPRGRLTAWWDNEACNDPNYGEYSSDIVLAPYTSRLDEYPLDKTYFFPFATDPSEFYYIPQPFEYDIIFAGREDLDRTKRVEYLDYMWKHHQNFLRTGGWRRGVDTSQHISRGKIILQISGDALKGVMETRCFEMGSIGLLAQDRHDMNKDDLDWYASPDYHYIAFNSKEEMVEKIKETLSNESMRLEMAKRGRANVLKHHTYDVRAQQLLEHLGVVPGNGLLKLSEKKPLWEDWADVDF